MSKLTLKPDLNIIESNLIDNTAEVFYQYCEIISRHNYITTTYNAKYVYSSYKINNNISFSMIHINIQRKIASFHYKAYNKKSAYKQMADCFNEDFISILEDFLCYVETEDMLALFGT